MTTINLKDFYYWYTQDQFIEVSDEVAEVFVSDARHEMAYQRRLSRHKAQYSLDCDDGIEYSACLHEPTPQELLERMETFLRLWNALNSLPEIQGRSVGFSLFNLGTYQLDAVFMKKNQTLLVQIANGLLECLLTDTERVINLLGRTLICKSNPSPMLCDVAMKCL